MTFEDALSNSRTVILGYDSLAQYGIDEQFDEIDISSNIIDTSLDVRLSDATHGDIPPNWQSHTAIIPNPCLTPSNTINNTIVVEISTPNWPITASWESELFNQECNDFSFFTSAPGGWGVWDIGGLSEGWAVDTSCPCVRLGEDSTITFGPNVDLLNPDPNDNYAYVNEQNDTVSLFFISLRHEPVFTSIVSNAQTPELILYPTVVHSTVNLTASMPYEFESEQSLEVKCYNSQGNEFSVKPNYNSTYNLQLNVDDLPPDVYIMQLLIRGERINKRFVKI